ncbi:MULTISPECIES: MFS transporter [Bacillaceae]|uniref:DHA2 family multidrug resistance protein-like MFS transporter n=1 Tax=Peribacillus huizhouensis TaxID=1501239 RepID=A0ABR6CN50_9BACI|nr:MULTISPECIES: MFS transporter [Bacillaceae]MBA9026349.1 DHA2 family multidrug resistance protein-like MFS transporter [Peribacillus huizhouensis]
METSYKGNNRMMTGIVFGVLTYWLFSQSLINVMPEVQLDMGISMGLLNTAISLSGLFSGMFIVAAGGISDRIGRKKITTIGLLLNIIGSLCLVFAQETVLLIIGRVIQGISAACIMPATIALVKTYFDGPDRQRAISYWSFGSWGGIGICSLAGGLIATYMGWRWIFIFSIIFTLLSMFLIKDVPESKAEQSNSAKFDFPGFVIFLLVMVALNVVITHGDAFGWTSPLSLTLMATTVIGGWIFLKLVKGKSNGFIDLSLFKNKYFTGATVSNFLISGVAGALIVANTYVQMARGYSSFQSGLLSIGNLVATLAMIRIGEKILQRSGPRKPMVIACLLVIVGIILMTLTFLPNAIYSIVVFIGFTVYGIGLGLYATPSTDTAVDNVPAAKAGEAAGIYKMSSTLGNSFGLAISVTVYSVVEKAGNMEVAASMGLLTNAIFAGLALLAIVAAIPKKGVRESMKVRKAS